MATVKVFIEPHESEEEVQELLLKALTHHEGGAEHKNAFHEPAARDVFNRLIQEHNKMMEKTVREIFQLLEDES